MNLNLEINYEKENNNYANNYFILCFLTHFAFISISLIPGLRVFPYIAADSNTYIISAQNLMRFGAFSREPIAPFLWEPYRTPGYPILIALSILLTHKLQYVLYLSSITAGVAGWSAVRLSKLWGGDKLSQNLAGIMMAFLPNSLGLSSYILTDAITGHLTIYWIYLLLIGFNKNSKIKLILSSIILIILESLKPSLNIAWFLLIFMGIFYSKKKPIKVIIILCVTSQILPFYLSYRNYKDHNVFTPSLLGVETARYYLQARYIADQKKEEYSTAVKELIIQDNENAKKTVFPSSKYGRLYIIRKKEVRDFLLEQPFKAIQLMFSEMMKQFLAPQEFAFQVFHGDLTIYGRVLCSIITVLIWFGVFWSCIKIGLTGDWKPIFLTMVVILIFLVPASISYHVGARLRFPVDLALIPFSSIGYGMIFNKQILFTQKNT